MDQKVFKKRVLITGLFILGIACFFIYRLADLHFSKKIHISSKKTYDARRGIIKDKNGNILAVSIERDSLYVNPEEINNPGEFARILSPVIGLSEKFILERIKRQKRFVWIKRKIGDEEVKKIKNLNLKGPRFIKEYHRVYPHENLAANILGFTDIDNNGLEGIEYKYNDILLSEEKPSLFSLKKEKRLNSNIVLTIDKNIQYFSEREIKQAVIGTKAIQGSAIVMEVKTGKILAIAKYPSFDPNHYFKYSEEARGNYSIANSFEPGSTLKIIALAAILEKNFKVAQKEYNCSGSMDIGDATIKCTKIHGKVNMADIIKYSCNVGIMQAMKNISKEDFLGTLKKFGFGDKTGIELPGESVGILRPVKEWSGLSKFSISIGQEISMNSIQLIAAFNAIANGGEYLYPTIIERIEDGDGTTSFRYSPRGKGKIISGSNAVIILQMMRSVVSGGTGELANLEYYSPAGKTGTAQKSMKRGGYYESKYVASFIGAAPHRNPDICVLVVLDEPKSSISGGEAAAPAFARIAGRVLAYRGERINKIAAKQPSNINPQERKFDGVFMPNFSGLPMSESIGLLLKIRNTHNINYNFIGKGRVYKQIPNAGTKLTGKQEIVLYLRDQ